MGPTAAARNSAGPTAAARNSAGPTAAARNSESEFQPPLPLTFAVVPCALSSSSYYGQCHGHGHRDLGGAAARRSKQWSRTGIVAAETAPAVTVITVPASTGQTRPRPNPSHASGPKRDSDPARAGTADADAGSSSTAVELTRALPVIMAPTAPTRMRADSDAGRMPIPSHPGPDLASRRASSAQRSAWYPRSRVRTRPFPHSILHAFVTLNEAKALSGPRIPFCAGPAAPPPPARPPGPPPRPRVTHAPCLQSARPAGPL
jgi:hypothetical protein